MNSLQKLSTVLLRALKTHSGQWVDQSQIARTIGRKSLTACQRLTLWHLLDKGQIEARHTTSKSKRGRTYLYRAL